jgi:hypothetical protein
MAQAWEYDGVDLTRYGYNVRLLGAPLSTPPRRGENLVIPHKSGRAWVAKALDERVQTLAMWVIDEPASGGVGSEANMLANLDVLRGLFARPGQHTLKHQFGTVTRLATVEVVRQVEFAPKVFNAAYVFMVEFLMADPLWYAENSVSFGPTNITMDPQNFTVINNGTYRAEKAVYTLEGTFDTPTLTLYDHSLTYHGPVTSGNPLVIDCAQYKARIGSQDVSGNISHTGGVVWLPIPPGPWSIECTHATGMRISASFREAYI